MIWVREYDEEWESGKPQSAIWDKGLMVMESWENSKNENIRLPDLFELAETPEKVPWQPFRPGVEIHWLYGDGQQGPAAALLKYVPGASVPFHTHSGYEHIIVLSGAQQDHQGHYSKGSLVINPPETAHSVTSESGCIVLIIWEKPVKIGSTDS